MASGHHGAGGRRPMRFMGTGIEGLWVVEDEPREDARGSFVEAFRAAAFADRGLHTDVAQVNFSTSLRAGTVRGLHWQAAPHWQTKLVRCARGSVYDVAVDVRAGSPSRGAHFATVLTAENGKALYIPEGFAHGWQALSDGARILYLVAGSEWSQPAERGLRHDDPALGIAWPIVGGAVSDRDRAWPDWRSLA